jgi:hypothetical protein
MADPVKPAGPAPAEKPAREVLEGRWKDVVEAITERPRDVPLLIQAGDLSEQLDRRPEAWNYYYKAVTLDPSKTFLIAKLRPLAATQAQKDDVTRMSRRPGSFTAGLSGVFKYPLRGKGLAILIMGAVLLWVARSFAAHGGRAGLTIAAIVAAYMAMFYIDVCHTTVGGDDELPEWPDVLRLHEFGLDVGKFIVAFLVSFLPVILIVVFAVSSASSASDEDLAALTATTAVVTPEPEDDEEPATARAIAPPSAPAPAPPPVRPEVSSLAGTLMLSLIGLVVFGIVGLVYLPMATLANVVMGSPFTCVNFPFVFRSIGAAGKDYAICLAFYFGTSIAVALAEIAVKAADIMLFTGIGLAFLELAGMTMLMRMLGLFYRMNQAKLGWMAD